jgi:hypothetical protein
MNIGLCWLIVLAITLEVSGEVEVSKIACLNTMVAVVRPAVTSEGTGPLKSPTSPMTPNKY